MKELPSRLHGQCADLRGNSDSKERMSLINEFLKRFGDRQIACLTADREFVGQDWLSYLLTDPLTPCTHPNSRKSQFETGRAYPQSQCCISELKARTAECFAR